MAAQGQEALIRAGSRTAAELEVPERAVYMIYLTIFIDILATTISTPVMPFYAQMFGATTVQIGYLFAAWSFCSTAFAPVLGRLSDQYGRRPILITALLGAGFANVCQGLSVYAITVAGQSVAFYIFGFFRGFSGVFAAIGTVTNVYMADVVPKPLLPDYMARMSIVGPLAFTFGPGLGGGLASIGGNNIPVLVDGIITLFSAFLVASHLPETPAFLKMKTERDGPKDSESTNSSTETPRMPWQVYVLATASFFGGLTMSAGVSMQAIALNQVWGLDVLHVTYVYVGTAVTLVLTGMFVSTRVKNCFGLTWTVVLMNTIGGFLYLFMTMCGHHQLDVWFFVVASWLANAQSSVAGASTGPLLNEYTETSNRGKVNSTNQLYMSLGRMLGPLAYGHIAEHDINLVWAVAGIALFVKAFMTAFVRPKPEEGKSVLAKKSTQYGEAWEDEIGGLDDEKEIGKFVAGLLTKGHYRWLSRRSDIESLLEKLLPELCVESKDVYENAVAEMEIRALNLRCSCQS